MYIPGPVESLFAWIESKGLCEDGPGGRVVGYLFSRAEMKAARTKDARPGGTEIAFFAEGSVVSGRPKPAT